MRRITVWAIPLGLTALLGCGSDEEEPATVTVTADEAPIDESGPRTVVASVEPQHDGTVVMTGDYPVEVVAHESGQVYAYVHGDAPPPGDVRLTVEVPVEGRSSGRPVLMTWNPRNHRWEGRVRRLTVVPGPLDVRLVVGGVAYHGLVETIVVAPVVEVHVHEGRRKHKHKHRGHGRRKHRGRGGIEIRLP